MNHFRLRTAWLWPGAALAVLVLTGCAGMARPNSCPCRRGKSATYAIGRIAG